VPNIDKNLLGVPQLVKKGFKVIFEDNMCLIKDVKGKEVFKIKMKAKNYALNQPIKKALPETYEYYNDDIDDVSIRRSNDILVKEFKVDDRGIDVLTKASPKARFEIFKDKPRLCSN